MSNTLDEFINQYGNKQSDKKSSGNLSDFINQYGTKPVNASAETSAPKASQKESEPLSVAVDKLLTNQQRQKQLDTAFNTNANSPGIVNKIENSKAWRALIGDPNEGFGLSDMVDAIIMANPATGAVEAGAKAIVAPSINAVGKSLKPAAELFSKLPEPVQKAAKIGSAATGYEAIKGASDPDYVNPISGKKTLPAQTGASIRAGIGDTLENFGQVAQWKGQDELGQKLINTGKDVSEGYEVNRVPFSWKSFFDPDWYANNVASTLPSTAALIPFIYAGYKGAGSAAGKLGASPMLKTIVASLGGATLSRPLESAMEAGNTYEEVMTKTGDKAKADEAAERVFKDNLKLAGLDAAQLATAFMPAPAKIAGKSVKGAMIAGKLGLETGTEALEEGYQQAVQQRASGADNRSILQQIFNPDAAMKESMAIGGVIGLGLGGAGSINDILDISDKVMEDVAANLSPEQKTIIAQDIENNVDQGMDLDAATLKAYDNFAETEEGKEAIAASSQTVAQEKLKLFFSGNLNQLMDTYNQKRQSGAEPADQTQPQEEQGAQIQVEQPADEQNIIPDNTVALQGELEAGNQQENVTPGPQTILPQEVVPEQNAIPFHEIKPESQSTNSQELQAIEQPAVEQNQESPAEQPNQAKPASYINFDDTEAVSKENKQPAMFTGKSVTAKTERGTSIDAQYAVVDANDLIASHSTGLKENKDYPQELQPRDRSRIASEDQITRILNNLEPEFLGESPKVSEGAPIVGPDMIVESGNGRIIALKRGYENNHKNMAAYKKWLTDNADKFGIDTEKLGDIKNPVLVRVRKSEVGRVDFVKEANEQSVAAMSATEQAVADAEKLTPELLSRFYPSESGDILAATNRGFIADFMAEVMGANERGRYITSDGSISQEGATRIRNAVFAKAYGNIEAIEKLAESTDNNIKLITNAMLIVAPRMVKMKAAIEEGSLYPLDITEEIAMAARKLSQLREEGTPVDEYLNQISMFGDELSPLAKDILEIFSKYNRGSKSIIAILNGYIDAVAAAGHPDQAGLWGNNKPPTKLEVLQVAVKRTEGVNGQETQTTLFGEQTVDSGETGKNTEGTRPEKDTGKQEEITDKPEAQQSAEPGPVKAKDRSREWLDKMEADARKRIDSRKGRMLSGLPMDDMLDYAIIGMVKLARKTMDFAEFTKEMIAEFGEVLRNWMPGIYAQSQAMLDMSEEQISGMINDASREEQNIDTKDSENTIELNQRNPNANSVITDFVIDKLNKGEKFSNKELFEVASKSFGGTMGQGKYSPKDAYDAMELGVNKWLLQQKFLRSPESAKQAQEVVGILQDTLSLLPTQRNRTEEMDEFQQFSTPPSIAYIASWVANVNAKDTILEPSAGIGGLAVFGKIAGAKVIVNELSPRRAEVLKEMGFDQLFTENAEQINNILPKEIKPTVVIMNPPFSSTAGRNKGKNDTKNATAHIEQALKRLEPNGRLIAILGRGMVDNSPTFKPWWDKLRAKYTVQANIGINGNNYTKYGTSFDVQIVVIDNIGPNQSETITGRVDNLKDIIPKLEGIRNGRPGVDSNTNQRTEQNAGQPNSSEATSGSQTVPDAGRAAPVSTDRVGTGKRESEDSGDTGTIRNERPSGSSEASTNSTLSTKSNGTTNETGANTRGNVAGNESVNGKESSSRGSAIFDGNTDRSSKQSDAEGNRAGVTIESKKEPQKSSETELTDAVYSEYVPQKLNVPGAKPHPADLVQSSAMASVEPPNPKYTPNLPEDVIKEGKLSLAQIEAVVYAGQAHQETLPDGKRKGFFIGDGTGVGKGREIAAIILDNMRQGNKKAVWVTEKKGLLKSAQRDYGDIGGNASLIFDHGKIKSGAKVTQGEGIAFTTYTTLGTGQTITANGGINARNADVTSRLDQLITWLGEDFDGVIAFDEAHNMQNSLAMKGARGTTKPAAKALAGVELQNRLPNAKVVYASATGATEVENLAYADRLGLWGYGTPFADKRDFVSKIASSGLAAMELVARDMKAMGSYIARNIGFNGVTYSTLEHKLTAEQREIYDEMAEAWQIVLQNIDDALAETGAVDPDTGANTRGNNAKAKAMSAFWGAQQRFFNQIFTSMQMPSAIEKIKEDLRDGKAIVLQLVNTNEAQLNRALAEIEEDQSLEDIDMTPRAQLMMFLEKSFPIWQYEEYTDEDGNIRSRPVLDGEGNMVVNPDALAMRDELLDKIGAIKVPDGPMEILFNEFGTDMVAEITGRTRRVVKTFNDETGKWEKKSENRTKNDQMADENAFMDDRKQILVFSDAGGTGRSYHADRTRKNQRQRKHYLIQAGWTASKAVQGFGRTHRSNQSSAPEYVLVTTDLKGQKRFISSIARRLNQLGALTKGQRQAAGQGLFSEKDNLEGPMASDALERFFVDLINNDIEELSPGNILQKMGLSSMLDEHGNKKEDTDLRNVPKFLNRLLTLDSKLQNQVFDEFMDRLDLMVDSAIANGTLDTGMENYKADKSVIVNEETVFTEPKSGAETKLVEFEAYHKVKPLTFKEVQKIAELSGFLGYYRNTRSGKLYAIRSKGTTTTSNGSVVNNYYMYDQDKGSKNTTDEITFRRGNWERIDNPEGMWNEVVDALPEYRKQKVHLITGALLPIWDRLPTGKFRVVRVLTDDGRILLGRVIPERAVDVTRQKLGAGSAQNNDIAPNEIADKIMDGYVITLSNGWKINRRLVSGETRIEITGNDLYRFANELKSAGVFSERINYNTRFFIPAGKEATQVISKIIKYRPIADVSKAGSSGEAKFKADFASLNNVLDLNLKPAPDAMNRPDMQAADILAKLIAGTGVIPFRGKGVQGVAYDGQIFLNDKTRNPLMYVAKHEIFHLMSEESQAELIAIAQKHAAGDAFFKYYRKHGYSQEEIWEEFTADAVSEVMEHADFWAKVRTKAPKIIAEIIDIIDTIIAKFKKEVGKNESKLRYINDLEGFKDKVAGVIARNLQNKPRNPQDMRAAGEFAAKQKADGGNVKSGSIINKESDKINPNNIEEVLADAVNEGKAVPGTAGKNLRQGQMEYGGPEGISDLTRKYLSDLRAGRKLPEGYWSFLDKPYGKFDPKYPDYPIAGARKIVIDGLNDFSSWSKAMTKDYGFDKDFSSRVDVVWEKSKGLAEIYRKDMAERLYRAGRLGDDYEKVPPSGAFLLYGAKFKYEEKAYIRPITKEQRTKLAERRRKLAGLKSLQEEIDRDINAAKPRVTPRVGLQVEQIGEPPQRRSTKPDNTQYAFDNPEIEKQWQESKGIDQTSALDKFKMYLQVAKNKATREFEYLPKGAKWANARYPLLQLLRNVGAAVETALRGQQWIVLDMNAGDYDLFTRKVILDDLYADSDRYLEENRELPFGFESVDELEEALNKIDEFVDNNEVVSEAVERRDRLWEETKAEYLDAMDAIGFDASEKLSREKYYHHQVLEFADVDRLSMIVTGSKLKSPTYRGFLKKRVGSSKNYNTEYMQAEVKVMAQMLHDIEIARTIKKIDDNYNVIEDLRAEAKSQNENNLQAIVDAENSAAQAEVQKAIKQNDWKTVGEYGLTREKVESDKFDISKVVGPTEQRMKSINRIMGMAFGELNKLAKSNELWVGENNEWSDVVGSLSLSKIDRLAGNDDVEVNALYRYLSALAAHGEEGSREAAIILKYTTAKRQFKKDALGKQFKTWEDLIPEGYVVWQPRAGTAFYFANSISDRLAAQLYEEEMKVIGVSEQDIRRVLARGQRYKEFVIPEEVALTLDNLKTGFDQNFIAELQKLWKVYVLVAPKKWFKYNVRNLTGDADAVFCGNPAAFKNVPQAVDELYQAFFGERAFSPELREWFNRGGMQTLLQAQENININEIRLFKNLIDARRKNSKLKELPIDIWKKYWKSARLTTDFREAILRYAAFLSYKEQMENNAEGRPKNFGASIPEEVMALEDINDRAFVLSNQLLGAYDQISVTGQWLRQYLIPFWSWLEVNPKRYVQMIKNAANDGESASTVGRMLGAKTPILAYRLGKFAIKAAGFSVLLFLYNMMFWGDEEKELPNDVRRYPHIILGRRSDGTVIYFSRLGAYADFLEWFGADESPYDVADFLNGKRTLPEIIKDNLKKPANKLAGGITPFLKVPLELVSGLKIFYPDIFEPRQMRDRWEYLAQFLGVEGSYKTLAGRPKRQGDSGTGIEKLLWYESDPREAAYYDIMDQKYRYLRRLGKSTGGYSDQTEKSKALYYYKMAIKYKDREAADKYLLDYALNGGTSRGLEQSFSYLNPLRGLGENQQDFIDSLIDEDLEKLNMAIGFYNETIAEKDGQLAEYNEKYE